VDVVSAAPGSADSADSSDPVHDPGRLRDPAVVRIADQFEFDPAIPAGTGQGRIVVPVGIGFERSLYRSGIRRHDFQFLPHAPHIGRAREARASAVLPHAPRTAVASASRTAGRAGTVTAVE